MSNEPLTSPAIDLIRRHRSIRDFESRPVAPEIIEAIISAAQCSSTSLNLQAWSVVAVTDPDRRSTLAGLCGNQKQVSDAPVFLIWCADLSRLDRVCHLRGYSQVTDYMDNLLSTAMDATIAAQTAALAAESLGLGICFVGCIRNNPQQVIDLLGLPKLVFPVTGMTLGWPAIEPAAKPRLPLNTVLHWEAYDREPDDQALAEYDVTMRETGIYEGRQVPAPGRTEPTDDYGWLEHCARRISQPARTDLTDALRAQGFGLK